MLNEIEQELQGLKDQNNVLLNENQKIQKDNAELMHELFEISKITRSSD